MAPDDAPREARWVDQCLASPMLQRRVPAELRDKTQAAMWSHATALGLALPVPQIFRLDL